MIIVTQIPASNPGEFLCEFRSGTRVTKRAITVKEHEANQMHKSGATVWFGRHGGWIRKF
jgi:hypothetical protein